MIQAIDPTGNAADLQSAALVDSARNVSTSNNAIYYNATELVEQDDSLSVNSPIRLFWNHELQNRQQRNLDESRCAQ
jgi:hypothetical protein